MVLARKVFSNFVLQITGRILALFLGLFIIGLMMRYLGPKNYGYYSISIAFLQLFGIIADFGLYLITLSYLGEADALSKERKEKRTKFIIENIFTLRFFSAFIFYGGAVLLSFILPYPQLVKTGIAILSCSLFFCTLIQTLSAFYQKTFKTRAIFLGEVLGKSITLLLMILFVYLKLGFYWILSVFVFGYLANFLVLFFSFKYKNFLKFRFDFNFWKEILKKSWPVGLGIVFNVLYFKADTLILSFYQPAQDVGFYGGCYRILEVLITIPPLFLGLVLPQLAKAWKSKEIPQFKTLFQKSFDFLIMLALPIVFGTLILGRKIMTLVGGREFLSAGDILRIVIIGCGILFVGELFKQLAVVLGKQKQILVFYILTAIFSLTGYFILIHRYSYWGAAIMTVVSELIMFVFAFCLFYKTTRIFPNFRFFIKSLAASILMFLILYILSGLNIILLVLIGGIIYFVLLYLFKAFDKDLIKEIIKLK